MNAVSTLDLRIKRPLRNIPQTEWDEWTSEGKVLSEMLAKSGLQDKTVAIEISVDPAIVSKAKTGQARFSETDMDKFMDACGSEAWLHFWLLKRGYDPRRLHRFETELERRVRLAEERVAELEREREIEKRFVRELRVAA